MGYQAIKRNLIKILFTFAVLFACLGFAACGENISLSAPANLRLEGGALCWDSVEGAEGYTVYINGEENTTSDCRLFLGELDETMVYSFEVQAYGSGGYRSPYSDISYVGKYTLPTDGLEYVYTTGLGMDHNAPHYMVSNLVADEDGVCVIPAEYEGLPVQEFSLKETPEAARIKELYLPNSMYKYNLLGSDFACFPNLERITIAEGNETAYSEGNCLIEKETNKLLVGCIDSVIPSCVTEIGRQAFENRQIKEIYIPDNVTRIGGYAFYKCTKLEKVRLPQRLEGMLSYVFVRCTSLNNVVISDGVESLKYTFWGCSSLTDVTLPDSVTEMLGAFRECTSLKEVAIPAGVKVLDETFRGCTGLESFTVPGTVEKLRGAFWDCTSLKSVVVEEGVKTFEAIGTVGAYYGVFHNCVSLTDVSLPRSLEKTGMFAFYNCKLLESIVIPNGVIDVGSYSFRNCTSLKHVRLSKNLEYMYGLSHTAFENCTSLEFIDIPASITMLKPCFQGCTALKAVVLPKVLKTEVPLFRDCPLEEVYYRGTEEEWEENKGTIYKNDTVLFAATRYYYSETPPETEGNFWHYVDDLPVKW